MFYSLNDIELAERISPHSIIAYLKATDWKMFPSKRKSVKVFQKKIETDDFTQVVIPMTEEFNDYASAMLRAVKIIAKCDDLNTTSFLLSMLTPNADVLKIRIDNPDIETGNIYFDDAIRVYENVKKLILAAAQDVVNPKVWHKGRVDNNIIDFVNNCRFGQTEVGSYIIPVVCPFMDLNKDEVEQLNLFSNEEMFAESMTRKVTTRIMNNLAFIKNSIDSDECDKILSNSDECKISGNFYEALRDINPGSSKARVEFLAEWSPVVKQNKVGNKSIRFSRNHYEIISSAIDTLKGKETTKDKIIGRIKRMEADMDASKRSKGVVSLSYISENSRIKHIMLELSKEDYINAIHAHTYGNYVEVIGVRKNSNNRFLCDEFNVIE